jgi:hypothetical protein
MQFRISTLPGGARLLTLSLPALLLGTGCPPGGALDDDDACDGVGVLGCGQHDPDSVALRVLGTEDDGLDVPRDLAFNPEEPGELWTVNRDDDSVVIFREAGTEDQESEHIVDPYAFHFMEEPSSIAFGAPGTFATCQESDNTYNHSSPANDFMGPALWSSDPDIFGISNGTQAGGCNLGLGSHIDMLHESPFCMGIEWEDDNVYWVFDGAHSAIVRYDFHTDHGVGCDDHSDGEVARYVQGEVDRKEDVPSHLALDRQTGFLYVADTGNSRVAVLDTSSGEEGDGLQPSEPGVDYYRMEDAEMWTLFDGDDWNVDDPSGLVLHDGLLFVSDHDNGNILAFNLDGDLVDWLETGRDGVMGLEFSPDGELWFVDAEEDELVRVGPGAGG